MTSRRSLLRAFFCATACAAMEVFGLKPSMRAEVVTFEPSNYLGKIHWYNLYTDSGREGLLREINSHKIIG